MIGDKGVDHLYGGFGNDGIEGGDNDDWCFGEQGNDQVNGDAGHDHLFGNQGRDNLSGIGNDYLDGGHYDGIADDLWGDEGADTHVGEWYIVTKFVKFSRDKFHQYSAAQGDTME